MRTRACARPPLQVRWVSGRSQRSGPPKAVVPSGACAPGGFFCGPRGARMSSDSGNAGTGPLRVLVAEDQAIIRLDLRGVLEKHGLIVCAEASNGEEAVELARSSHPDVALLDMRMPKLDGIEAARRMYAERPIPIVMLTAFSDRAVVEKAIAAGVFAYLVKPFKETDLVPALRAAVARHAELLTARRAVGEKPLRPVVISVRSPSGNEWPIRVQRTEDGELEVQVVDEREARP